jgi:hypothetical protein
MDLYSSKNNIKQRKHMGQFKPTAKSWASLRHFLFFILNFRYFFFNEHFWILIKWVKIKGTETRDTDIAKF